MARERAYLAVCPGQRHEPGAGAPAEAAAAPEGDLEPDRQGEAEGVHADPPAHVHRAQPGEGRGRPGAGQAAVRQAGGDRRARGEEGDRAGGPAWLVCTSEAIYSIKRLTNRTFVRIIYVCSRRVLK